MITISLVLAYFCIGLVITKIDYEVSKKLRPDTDQENGILAGIILWPLLVVLYVLYGIFKTVTFIGKILRFIVIGDWNKC